MSGIYFISDLHLDSTRPQIVELFCAFLAQHVAKADALYILGDLFEYWIGDDDPAIGLERILDSIRSLSQSGVPVYFLHGNRDFLVGKQFAKRTGCTILNDPSVIDLYGAPTLIMHGDTLCIDDIAYQRFRKVARNRVVQTCLLSLSVKQRLRIAKSLRDKSQQAIDAKSPEIMDVNNNEVMRVMKYNQVNQLIHGHTHRPHIHEFTMQNQSARRIVLGDWYEQGSYLLYTKDSFALLNLS